MVSVIITTYKREFDIIEKSIKSVLAQTYKDFELIVVDDNPSDSEFRTMVEEGLKAYPEIVYVKHAVNSGAQVSRNDGIKAAKGEYLAFLDDDDIWFENKLECQMKCFTQGVGLVFCKGYTVYVGNGEEKTKPYNMSADFISHLNFKDMLYGDYIGTTTQAVISREAIENCGMFDVNMPARQDYEMWIRISQKYECVGAEEYLFNHYIYDGEQISKSSKKALEGFKNIYKKYKPYYYKTARFHILMLISNSMKKSGQTFKSYMYKAASGFWLAMAFVFEHGELKKRMAIHNSKK